MRRIRYIILLSILFVFPHVYVGIIRKATITVVCNNSNKMSEDREYENMRKRLFLWNIGLDERGTDGEPQNPAAVASDDVDDTYGHVEGIEVGQLWLTRLECSSSGIHRPMLIDIHPGRDGVYSIVMSGGYVEDADYGESFTYTSFSDIFYMSLIKTYEKKTSVRIIRSNRMRSNFSPPNGFRYDGLYSIENYWTALGSSGIVVYKFLFRSCNGQTPPPSVVMATEERWCESEKNEE